MPLLTAIHITEMMLEFSTTGLSAPP